MSSITVTSWGHACVLVERAGQHLVIDPGVFTDATVLDTADAVLVTHEHVDHMVPDRLVAALAADPRLEVWAPTSVLAILRDSGAPDERLHVAAAGDRFEAAGFAVLGVGGEHAVIHPSIPTVANVGYLIEEAVLHPGDSFAPPPAELSPTLLLLPIGAPWLKLAESADYLQTVKPRMAAPIHDALLSDAGRALSDRILTGLAGGVSYRRLALGESLAL